MQPCCICGITVPISLGLVLLQKAFRKPVCLVTPKGFTTFVVDSACPEKAWPYRFNPGPLVLMVLLSPLDSRAFHELRLPVAWHVLHSVWNT